MIPCPCRRCRPRNQSLKQAIKICVDAEQVARYTHEGYEARKAAERARLEKLNHREKTNA